VSQSASELLHNRVIPSAVKLEVWQRDEGQCVLCGSKSNLHCDHDLPFFKGTNFPNRREHSRQTQPLKGRQNPVGIDRSVLSAVITFNTIHEWC
jgi:hypothetical protein